jgi:hypothetical protein
MFRRLLEEGAQDWCADAGSLRHMGFKNGALKNRDHGKDD